MPVKGTYLGVAGAGAVLIWSGLKGKSWSMVVRSLIAGKNPADVTASNPISGGTDVAATIPGSGSGGTPPNPVAQGTYKAYALTLLAKYGWGRQFASFDYVEMREAGYNPKARNPSSGALGMAQALGHGTANTAGSLGNQYGGFGVSDAICRAANSGNGYAQLVWMFAYVNQTYGSFDAAAAHEQANNWY